MGFYFSFLKSAFFSFCWKSGNTSMIKSSSVNPHQYSPCIVSIIFVYWSKSRAMQVQMFLRAPAYLETYWRQEFIEKLVSWFLIGQCFKLLINVETGCLQMSFRRADHFTSFKVLLLVFFFMQIQIMLCLVPGMQSAWVCHISPILRFFTGYFLRHRLSHIFWKGILKLL